MDKQPSHAGRRGRGIRRLVPVVLLAAVAAGCTTATVGATNRTAATTASAAVITISPRDGSRDVAPDAGVTVTVARGTLTDVRARADGTEIAGTYRPGHTGWSSDWALGVGHRYTVTVTAVDPDGRTATATSAFRTSQPRRTFRTQIFEGYRQTYGVGMPILLQFDQPIHNKKAVERALQISTSHKVVGAWYWDGDQKVAFRPRDYWPAGTVVHFIGHLDGVQGSPGVYGTHTLTQRFRIGRSLITVVNTRNHRMRVYQGHRLRYTWPISTGRPGDDTPNGTYLTIEKANPVRMVGPGYDLEVPYSVRITFSGDYLHDAYWSVGEQGFANVSHGCVNMSPAHAATYYHLSVPGDPVTVTGSPTAGTWGNGWTHWFLPWRQLVAGSALHDAVVAGPEGSEFVKPATLAPSGARPPLGTAARHNAVAG